MFVGGWVDLCMVNRITPLLLFIGFVWAQTDFDKLILKDGTTYLGEYSKTEGKIVYFKPHDAFGFQPIPVKRIRRLELKEGQIIIDGGKVKNSLNLDEYQKLSTKEKAIYDANLYNVKKWALYGPTSIIVFMGSIFLHKVLIGGEFWESPIFLGGSSAASLIIPYFVFNRKEKFNFPKSILTDTEKEIYKQAYSKKLRQRKFIYAAVSTIFAGGIVAVAVGSIDIDFSSYGGLDCGPPCGGTVDYP